MPPLAAQLAQAAVPVVALLALGLALRPRPRQPLPAATRARAQWLTVAASVVGLYLVAVSVVRATERNPLGIVVFLALCGYAVAAGLAVRSAWRSHRAALADEARATHGAPDVPGSPRQHHRGLSGEEPPPSRW